jgi:hypothetical protein
MVIVLTCSYRIDYAYSKKSLMSRLIEDNMLIKAATTKMNMNTMNKFDI